MIGTLVAFILVGAELAPCDPLEVPALPKPAEAGVYARVAEAELNAGREDTAVLAFRRAVELDPNHAVAKESWQRLCEKRAEGNEYDAALAMVNRRECTAALPRLSAIRSDTWRRPAALLAGICQYELNDDDAAERNLKLAAEDPALSRSARLFMVTLLRRKGDAAAAKRWLLLAQQDRSPSSPDALARLSRLLAGEGRLILDGSVGLTYDSNVNQTPIGSSAGAGQDGSAQGRASITARPLGTSGPFAFVSGDLTQQLTIQDLSLYGAQGGAGWLWWRGLQQVGLQYSYDYSWLGGPGYLSDHRLSAWAMWPVASFVLSAGYDVRFERYLPTVFTPYSGNRHTLSLGAAWTSGSWWVGLGYRGVVDVTADPTLSYSEHGPTVDLVVQPTLAWRVFFSGSVGFRPYFEFDESLGLQRSDFVWNVRGGGIYALTDTLSLVASVTARGDRSNVASLSYVEIITTASLVFHMGLL